MRLQILAGLLAAGILWPAGPAMAVVKVHRYAQELSEVDTIDKSAEELKLSHRELSDNLQKSGEDKRQKIYTAIQQKKELEPEKPQELKAQINILKDSAQKLQFVHTDLADGLNKTLDKEQKKLDEMNRKKLEEASQKKTLMEVQKKNSAHGRLQTQAVPSSMPSPTPGRGPVPTKTIY